MSDQRTYSSAWLCLGFPEEFMDDCCSDVPMDEGDLAGAYEEAQKPPYPRPLQRTLGRRGQFGQPVDNSHVCSFAHLQVQEDLKKGNCETVVIPGGCKSVVQPMDTSLNKPFKGHVRAEWLSFMEKSVTKLEKQQDNDSNHELNVDPFASTDEDENSARDEIQ